MNINLNLLRTKLRLTTQKRLCDTSQIYRLALSPALILILLTLSACAVTPVNNKEDSWFSRDKYAHFVLSGLAGAAIARAAKEDGKDNCDAALLGIGITMSLGAAKESYDKRHKKTLYSYKDMSWNLLGSSLGSLAGSNCH